MNQSNQCPKCGGVAGHLVTDVNGENYYHCTTGLTTFREKWDEVAGRIMSRVSRIVLCDTIIYRGKVFSGAIAYVTDRGNPKWKAEVKTLMVTDGKII